MNNFTFYLDLAWKVFFFTGVFSLFIFTVLQLDLIFLKKYAVSQKIKYIKWASLTGLGLAFAMTIVLFIFDVQQINDCFSAYAESAGFSAGYFGLTRLISASWLGVATALLIKDFLVYLKIKTNLHSAIIANKKIYLNSQVLLDYAVVSNSYQPQVLGFFTNTIFIPSRIEDDPSALKQILAHEFIHTKNKDGLWNLIHLILLRLNWYNPLAYLFFKKFKLNLEMATDEQALSDFNLNLQDYAATLVNNIFKSPSILQQQNLTLAASSEYLIMRDRLLNLSSLPSHKSEKPNLRYGLFISLILFGAFSQAYKAVMPNSNLQLDSEATMCVQVQHELILENLMLENSREPKERLMSSPTKNNETLKCEKN